MARTSLARTTDKLTVREVAPLYNDNNELWAFFSNVKEALLRGV